MQQNAKPVIEYPRNPLFRYANHSLWNSAFHLIHPDITSGEFQLYDWANPPVAIQNGSRYPNLGVEFRTECIDHLELWQNCIDCRDRENNEITKIVKCSLESYDIPPMLAYSARNCSTYAPPDFPAILENDFTRKRSPFIESTLFGSVSRPFWEGQISSIPDGQLGHPVMVAPDPLKPLDAVSLLEEALGNCLGDETGMIHLPISVASSVVNSLGERQRTVEYMDGMPKRELVSTSTRNNIIVVGAGYSDLLGPNGAVPDRNQAYIYATSFIYLAWDKLRIVPEELSQAVRRTTNDITYIAEQTIVPIYDPCCVFAALVSIP